MSLLLKINKLEYESLFNLKKNGLIKNFIIDFIDDKGEQKKKIMSGQKNIIVKNIKKILSVRYSLPDGVKTDVTQIILNYLMLKYTQDVQIKSNIRDITSVATCFNDFLHTYNRIFNDESGVNTYLYSILKCDMEKNDKFFNDTEHGFFHGLMASFICYVINNDTKLTEKKSDLTQLFISATLHDFLKCNNVPQEEHDKKLKQYYPKLCEETYVHSNPPDKYFRKHLIIADRLELRRYPDYKSWVDDRFHKLYTQMSSTTKNTLDIFYTIYRPALEYLFKHKNMVFVNHMMNTTKKIEKDYPPIKKNECYPIGVNTHHFWCNNHSGASNISAYMCIKDFKAPGVIIHKQKDPNLFTKSIHDATKWVYMYQDLGKIFFANKNKSVFLRLSKLIESQHMVMSHESASLLFQFTNMFKCRMDAL